MNGRGERGEQGVRGERGPVGVRTTWQRVSPILGYVILVVFLVASLAIFRHQEAENLERIKVEEQADIARLERESIARKEQVCQGVISTRRLLADLLVDLGADLTPQEAAAVTARLNENLCAEPDPPIVVHPHVHPGG